VFIGEILANITQVSDVAPGPLGFYTFYFFKYQGHYNKLPVAVLKFDILPKISYKQISISNSQIYNVSLYDEKYIPTSKTQSRF
jgi:hypothetical protein